MTQCVMEYIYYGLIGAIAGVCYSIGEMVWEMYDE